MTRPLRHYQRLLAPPEPDTAEFAYRRGGLLTLLACGIFVSAFTLLVQTGPDFSTADRLGLAVIIVKDVALTLWLWRRPRHFLAIGLTELLLQVVASVVRLHLTLHSPPTFNGLGGYAPWTTVTYLAAFLVLPTRPALGVSLAQFSGLMLVGLGFMLSPRSDPAMKAALGNTLLQTALVHATFIAFLTLQQRLLQHYVQALVGARHEATLAGQDALTGLPNRRQLNLWLRAPQPPLLSVVLFDLDHFKRVNDTYGHSVGDETLQHVAWVLRRTVRQHDRAGRWGGEEFLILVEGSAQDAALVADRVQGALRAAPYDPVGTVTISCGVAQAAPGETADTVLRRADEALYRAKRAGRDTVSVAA
ncbi:GGDEF domain-containing protein [Deinococcus sp. HMF7604]|uniref:GGDEF domain-containing protein n=1 Tax=Deinococcus betulae TaxID=2873312 RepID=UPI001CCB4B22|nr:GGDEF domain-containing protein [Deinococcus betulae]